MDSVKDLSSCELLDLLKDPQSKIKYMNMELAKVISDSMSEINKEFYMDLPYETIANYVEKVGEQILSKFSLEEQQSLKWEHVGSTSIKGMPGTKTPDTLLIYDKFPPSSKIIDVLRDHSFKFFKVGDHLDENDLCFFRGITEEGYLKDSLMALHLVDKDGLAGKYLLGLRDLCRNQQSTFNEYKAIKLEAVGQAGNLFDYKMKKGQNIKKRLFEAVLNHIKEA